MKPREERPVDETTSRARKLRKAATLPEQRLWSALRCGRVASLKFRRQHPVGCYIVDFFCQSAGLVVEIDGESHAQRGEYDIRRQRFLESQGLTVLRFSNDDVLQDPEAVVLGIARAAGIDVHAWLREDGQQGRAADG